MNVSPSRQRIVTIISIVSCLLGALLPACEAMAAGAFDGTFSDGKLTAQWTQSNDGYVGTISLGTQKFQSAGWANGQAIQGIFVAGGNRFGFNGMLNGDSLTLVTGGTTYTLQRQSAGVNPLAAGQATGQAAETFAAGNTNTNSAVTPSENVPPGYGNVNTIAGDGTKLTAPAAGGAAGASTVSLHPYEFPDGTGVIGLADGWTTNARSCNGPVFIMGPANQMITMGVAMTVTPPNSNSLRNHQQLNANAQRMGGRPRPMSALISPLGDPVEVWKNLAPQLSARNQQSGGVTFTLDNVTEVSQAPSLSPRGRAVFANYGITLSANGQQIHRLVLAKLQVVPISNDEFKFGILSVAAPDATYKQDLPTMLAMTNSLRENAGVFAQQTQQTINGMNQRFAAQQASQQKVESAYDDYNKDMARNSVIEDRSNANEDEIIRGDRTVEDTVTGQQTSVDLGNVDQVVNGLNADQPGRYKEIPLRDQVAPLPAGDSGQ